MVAKIHPATFLEFTYVIMQGAALFVSVFSLKILMDRVKQMTGLDEKVRGNEG